LIRPSKTIDGTGNKTIDGGSGFDTLNISYAGISDIGSFTSIVRLTDDTYVLTDASGNQISFSNIGNDIDGDVWGYSSGLTINGISYNISSDKYSPLDIWYPGSSSSSSVIYSLDGYVGLVENADYGHASFIANRTGGASDLTNTSLKIYGTSLKDNIEGSSKADVIRSYAGHDAIHGLGGADQIYAGDGNDLVFVKADNLTTYTVLDGGLGSDTLNFGNPEGYSSGFGVEASVTVDLSAAGNATNFENITGSRYNDHITGDTQANILIGNAGDDIIYGGSGDDSIYGEGSSGQQYANHKQILLSDYNLGSMDTDDQLYGEAGDDHIDGNFGQDTIDGGTGSDTLTGGDGADTFILRAGDGSTNIALADIITDFEDGEDIFGLDDGLLYGDLAIEQGTGDYSNDTLVSITATGEYLAIVEGMSATALTEVDFTPVDIL